MTNKLEPIHVMPVEHSDVIEHVDSPTCPCNPVKEFKIDYEVPLYIHNKLLENPQ